jgi:3'(2'), 5'-bisphosphate nucleotidase
MYENEHSIAVAAVAEACRLTRQAQDEIVRSQAKVSKDDRSPVTVADLAAQVVVSHHLSRTCPDTPLLAEEDASALRTSASLADQVLSLARTALTDLNMDVVLSLLDRADHPGGGNGHFWLLDPIDGTKGFLRGDQYAIALAMIADGRPVIGVLGCPNLPSSTSAGRGCLLSAVRGEGAREHDLDGAHPVTIGVDDIEDPRRATLCASVESAHSAMDRTSRIAAVMGLGDLVRRVDSQCKYAIVARGEASLYLRLPRKASYQEKTWDHGAGSLVVEEAGGRVSDLGGRPLSFAGGATLDTEGGILASNRHLHDRALAAAKVVLKMT